MHFEIVGSLTEIEVIDEGDAVRQRRQLRKRYGGRRWRKLEGVGVVRLGDGSVQGALQDQEAAELRTTSPARKRFAICIRDHACDDLSMGKVYRILPDKTAAAARLFRVVDDSGEDYRYPASYFVFIELPSKAKRALAATRRSAAPRTA
jgi:hypothetical protein